MELYPGAYQIRSLYGGRNLFQYVLAGDRIVLIDTGTARTPEDVIFPFLERHKFKLKAVEFAITTHADLDHQGGNDAIKRASPGTLLACGEADRELVEHPRTLYDHRYNHLMEDHRVGLDAIPSPDAGQPRKMDVSFSGGERILLCNDWWLEVLHVPGHSQGHLALYDPKHRTAYTGDAVQGSGCPKAEGGIAIPVTYYRVDQYLSTLHYLEEFDLNALFTGHWPAMRGDEIKDFFADSRRTVELFDRAILSSLQKHTAGLTMKELIDVVADAAGDWPKDGQVLAMFPVKGHMDRLEKHGRVRALEGQRPVRWALT